MCANRGDSASSSGGTSRAQTDLLCSRLLLMPARACVSTNHVIIMLALDFDQRDVLALDQHQNQLISIPVQLISIPVHAFLL
jgi:hypothetical protein